MQNLYWPASLVLSFLLCVLVLGYVGRFEPANYRGLVSAVHNDRVFWLCAAIFAVPLALEATLSVLHAEAIQYEPEGASLIVAWLYGHGLPIYHSADSAERYSLLYGPMMYLPFSAIFKAGGGMVAARLYGLFWVLTAVVGMWWLVRRDDRRGYLFCLGLFSLCLILPPIFTGRADAASLAAVTLGAIAASAGSLAALACCCALAVGAKATAFLYFVPLLVVCAQARRPTPGQICLAAIMFASLVLAPFALPGVSLGAYCYWLRAAGKHGLLLDLLIMNIVVFLTLAAPALWACAASTSWRANHGRSLLALVVTLAAGLALSVPAAKVGSGYFHMVPFVPVLMLVMVRSPQWHVGTVQRLTTVIHTAFFLFALLFMARHLSALLYGERSIKVTPAVLAEVDRFVRQYRDDGGISMGSGQLGHRQTNAAFYTLRHGGAYLLNDVAMWDMEGASLPIPEATLSVVARCQISNWLVPAGDKPFRSANLYSPERMMMPGLESIFQSRYEMVQHGHYFDVWRCKAGMPIAGL